MVDTNHYNRIPKDGLWSQQLELYLGIYEEKLRFFTTDSQLLPTPTEVAEDERRQKELACSPNGLKHWQINFENWELKPNV
jgi:hypothetical protein